MGGTTVRVFLLRLAMSVAVFVVYFASPQTTSAATPYIAIEPNCNGGTSNARFTWFGNDPDAVQQWIHLSLTDNGFAPGTYFSAALAPSQNSVTLAQLRPGLTHFVRVTNQQLWTGDWDPSPTFVFNSAAVAHRW